MKNKKTDSALSGLEWAIAQTITAPRQPDEFTSGEFFEASGTGSTIAATRCVLARMVADGRLTRRSASIGGRSVSLYKRAI